MEHQPYYTLQVDVAACCYQFQINDFPLLEEFQGGQCVVELPLNQWIHAGRNTFAAVLTPAADARVLTPDVRFDAAVYVREMGDDRSTRRLLRRFSFPAAQPEQRLTQTPTEATVAAEFTCDVPFGPWRWQHAPSLVDLPQLRERAIEELRRLWVLCEAKNLDELVRRFSARNEELAQAYYKSLNDREAEFRTQFENLFQGSDQLGFFREEGIRLRILASGRAVRLDAQWNDSPLFYINGGWTVATYLPVIFMLGNDNALIPIR